MNLPKIAVKRPVLVSVIFIIMGLFGLYSLMDLPIDLMPEIESPAISVITIYEGAGSEEVEEKVTKVIEGALSTTADIKNISSRSMENVSSVTCEFEFGTNLSEATNDIRDKINMARMYLPDDVNEPMIFKFDFSMMPIIFVAVTSSTEDVRFKGDEIRDYIAEPIERIPGVGSVITFNEMSKKIMVSLDKQRLAALNLSVSDVAGALAAENLSLPGGHMEMGAFDYTIRVPGEFESIKDVEETIIADTPQGILKVKDIGRVFWGSIDQRQFGLKNGEYMIFMMVQKQSGANTVQVATAIQDKIKSLDGKLPGNMEMEILMDTSDFIVKMIGNLSSAVLTACLFVMFVVIFFLRRFKSSFIVLLSIPASLIIAFAFLYGFGYTLNMVSLMALSLAIGMVVDNSIVVLDNITRHLENGRGKVESAVDGTSEVGGAIIASTLTTVMIFAPLFFVGGIIGIMFGQLAGVVILTLSASLLAAMLLTPMVCSKILSLEESKKKQNWLFRFGETFLTFIEKKYSKFVAITLNNRKKTILISLAMFLGSLMLIPVIGVDFMPQEDEGMIQIEYELPLGSKIEQTLQVGQKIENIMIEEIPTEYLERTFMRGGPNTSGFSRKVEDTNTATVGVRIVSQNDRKEGVMLYANKIRTRVINEVPGIEKMDVKTSTGLSDMMNGGEKPVTIKLAHKDFKYSAKYAAILMDEMKKIPGLKDLSNDADSLKPEIEVKINRSRASQVGLKTSMIALSVREAFYGKTATIFRKDGDEYDVMVKYKKEDRTNLEQLKEMELKTLYGTTVKLKDVTEIKEGLTSLAINRLNRERIITIGARLEDNVAIGKVADKVDEAIKRANLPDNIELIYGGSIKNQQDTSGDLLIMLLLGIILVYLVMAAQFESFVDPFVIIFSIPFAISGVLIGLLVSGNTLSVPAFLGMIILVGIVVNNAIVLVDYTKLIKLRDNLSVEEALITAGGTRLRPILMTATTTIGGMIPLAMMSGEGHEMFNPMGIAVVFGLAVSTMITLILIPVMYASVDALLKKIKLR